MSSVSHPSRSRRLFLKSSSLALVELGFAPRFLSAALAETEPRRRKVLVTLFQRGAVDGLSMVPPYAEPRYFQLRPTIGLLTPGRDGGSIRLDDTFALHPALAPLQSRFRDGSLAIVHAAGSPDPTRSHFDAQDALDAGTPGVKSTRDGWLNRALQERGASAEPFRAVALQPNVPCSLAGRAPAVAMASLADFALRPGRMPVAAPGFESMYADAVDGALRSSGTEAFDAMRRLADAQPSRITPRNGAVYPATPLGKRMKEIAQLIRADVGLELAATDCGGWDTHAAQGTEQGPLANGLRNLAEALAAFAQDLGDDLADVCLVTMTEFGRTVRENGTRGTDHGHGSVMLVLGGGVKGGRVLTRWKGLSDAVLFEGRDLPVTTDHREVFAAVLRAHLGLKDVSRVFPGFAMPSEPLALFA